MKLTSSLCNFVRCNEIYFILLHMTFRVFKTLENKSYSLSLSLLLSSLSYKHSLILQAPILQNRHFFSKTKTKNWTTVRGLLSGFLRLVWIIWILLLLLLLLFLKVHWKNFKKKILLRSWRKFRLSMLLSFAAYRHRVLISCFVEYQTHFRVECPLPGGCSRCENYKITLPTSFIFIFSISLVRGCPDNWGSTALR